MRFKKPFLLFILSVVVLGIFGFSIWYRWSTEQRLAQQRIPELTPSAEFNHGSWINTVALSPTKPELIASGSIEDETLKVWNRSNTDTPLMKLTEPEGISFIAFSPTNEWLFSKSFSSTTFWDAASGEKISVFNFHASATAVLSDRHLLATATKDIRLWDISNLKEVKPLVVLPPKTGRQPLSHEEARSSLHDKETINQYYSFVDFSSDGKWVAAGGTVDDVNWQTSRSFVKVWDLQSRQLVKIFPRILPKGRHHGDIRSIGFSPDSRFFARVDSGGYTIWTLPEWHIHCNVRARTATESTSFSVDDSTKIGPRVGEPVQFFTDLAFSPDGQMYAVADFRKVTLYSTESVTRIALLKGAGGASLDGVKVIVFSQDGSIIAGGCGDGIVRLWDVGGLNEK